MYLKLPLPNMSSLPLSITYSFVLLLFFSCTSESIEFDKGITSVLTGWEYDKQKLSSTYCKNCHLTSHANWKDSIHAKSWTNSLFQKSYSLEPSPWCINCHAPLYAQKEEIYNHKNRDHLKTYLADEGINCAGCHVRNGNIYGHRLNLNLSHEVKIAPKMSSAEYCAGCHEFEFPITKNGKMTFSKETMQGTYSEWKHSNSKKTCIQCHWNDHDIKGPHTPHFLEKMISQVRYEYINPEVLSISFSIPQKRAHNFPSGDLFRSLSLEISREPFFKNLIFSRKFGRFFGMGRADSDTIWNRSLVSDTSIPYDQDTISTTIDIPKHTKLYGRLVYYTHDPDLGGENSIKESKIELTSFQIDPGN